MLCRFRRRQSPPYARGSTGAEFVVQAPGRCSNNPQSGLDRRRPTFCNSGCWYAAERYGSRVERQASWHVSVPKSGSLAKSTESERRKRAQEYVIIESVFGLAARRTKASKRANWLGRAGEAKTNWTNPPAPS
jgi:hypothetical protein